VKPRLFPGATWEADAPPISQKQERQPRGRLVTGRLSGIDEDRTPRMIGGVTPSMGDAAHATLSPGTTSLNPSSDVEMATFWSTPVSESSKPKPPYIHVTGQGPDNQPTPSIEHMPSDSSDSDEGGQIITIHSPHLVRTEKNE